EINVNLSGLDSNMGLSLTAGFNLVLNTTSQNITYNVPTTSSFASDQSGDTMAAPAINIYTSAGGSTPAQTATSVIIPAGAPSGEMTVTGGVASFANVGPIGPYLTIAGSGTLQVVGLTLTGDFQFEIDSSASGLVVSMAVDVSGTITGISGTATVIGAFQLDDAGLVAFLSISGNGSGQTDYGAGVTLTANFQLAIDTQPTGSNPVTVIGGVTLPSPINPQTYLLEGTGTLTLYLTAGTGFVITGSIETGSTTINGNSVAILSVSGNISATVASSTLLTAAVNGSLIIIPSQGGVAGELTVTLNSGNPLDGSGFTFSGAFDFEINTTNAQQTVPFGGGSNTINIQAGPYSQVHANGTLTFGDSNNGFMLTGDFYLSVSAIGLDISTAVSFSANVGGSTLMTLNALGALEITPAGIGASFSLSVSSGSPFSMGGAFSFSGTFLFQVNTTGQGINTTIGTVPLDVPAGPYIQVAITNASLDLGSGTGFALNGSFYLTVSSSGMAVSATASLAI